MSNLINATQETYRYVFHELVDHRSDDWLLMSSPWIPVSIVLVYFYFVKTAPQYMKDRPAYNLDKVICVYNVFQIVASAKLFLLAVYYGWGGKFRVFCQPVDYSNDPDAVEFAVGMWEYYLLKIIDLLDTVFFILRKKQNQVTFLHVYHHGGMVIIGWIWARYIPGGHGTLSGTINCFVHMWMYLYYFLTHMWPEYKQRVWWKRYLTQLQMVQFIIIIAHLVPVFLIDNCPFPRILASLLFMQNVAFLGLFWNFYKKSYLKKKIT